MARLIDVDALKKAILAEPWKDQNNAVRLTVDYINIIIDEQPTVDAVPAVHGRWIPTYHTYYNRDGECKIADEWHCSECEIYSKGEWHYCPNCGAKMDLEVE